MERIPHWDYVWENDENKKMMGMIIFPNSQGKHMHIMKKMLKEAHRSKKTVPITILQDNTIVELQAVVWEVDFMESAITLKDLYGNFHDVRMYNVINIGSKRRGKEE
ncbi:hypothetical protein [Priestia taiwanensis]|uniref:Uncharacterized protein n=1 Tax=Priestia taiwanensis TaxID=1347902 RepID=A0A917ERG9_9BACI|nr:hypothetical protein [Priestia taiwanensis]MBM7363969.1 hypothetical protein [Priestia taiwanensis]GGE70576.1 hypothetical protein GCM10007140_20600 [Priestia taiwanensis]